MLYTRYLNQNLILLTVAILSIVLIFPAFVHGVETLDLYLATESASYVILLVHKVMILASTKCSYEQYQSLLRAMKEDFQHICMNPSAQKYRQRFFDSQLLTWKLSLFSIAFVMFIPVGMISFATAMLAAFLVTRELGDGGQRPLLFPFRMTGVDFGATPYYELGFMFANLSVFLYVNIQTQVVWVRHIATKADIVIWNIEDLLIDVHPTRNREENEHFTKVIKQRMRHIITQHQSMYSLMDEYIKVYKKLLMFEQKICTTVICLSAYCIAEKLDEGELQIILCLTLLSTIIHSVCDACWNTPFWNASKVVRPYYVLIMQRAMRPLPLQAAGFDEISMQTFSA
ncbi:Olfactory receptor, partial [Operophtera brumata]